MFELEPRDGRQHSFKQNARLAQPTFRAFPKELLGESWS